MTRIARIGLLVAFACSACHAQTYQNVRNQPFATVSSGPQEAIVVDIDGLSPEAIKATVIGRVREVQKVMSDAARPIIREMKTHGKLPPDSQLPITQIVILRKNGKLLTGDLHHDGISAQACLSLAFSSVPAEKFDDPYRLAIQQAFDDSTPVIDGLYGAPFACGPINVINYDAQIGDRDAVIGGIFLPSDPNHGNQPTILFPVYNSLSTAAVNLINLLVHAYHGSAVMDYDAWEHGFSRAVTMAVVRQLYPTGNLTFPQADLVLEATYEFRQMYDWHNQPSLGNNVFIAPSLKDKPIGNGTLGGVFQFRYMMSASAWAKVMAEYPSFFKNFNASYYADVANLKGNVPGLRSVALANAPMVEGLAFDDWFVRQYVLDTSVLGGRKLFCWVVPVLDNLFAGETGAYRLFYEYFQTDKTGDELALMGTGFPIYWTRDFARMNLGPQYERIDFTSGTGTVVPSFTDNTQNITIDMPVADVVNRLVLPLGTVAQQTFANNVFGTVLGLTQSDVNGKNGTATLKLASGDTTMDITNGAFGATVVALVNAQRATIEIRDLSDTLVLTRQLDTGPELLGVNIKLTEQTSLARQFPKGIQMVSLPLYPFEKDSAKLFGLPANQFLFARWRQDLFRYALYPSTPPVRPGTAFFFKPTNPVQPVTFNGIIPPSDQAFAVPLQVGWNQVGNPILAAGSTDIGDVWVQSGPDDPAIGWSEAVTKGYVSPVVFRFDQEISNPDAGTSVPTTTFDAFSGYWVRVEAAEGVTILFRPTFGLGPHKGYQPPQPAWSAKFTMVSEMGDRTGALIGLDRSAGNGFDVRFDAPLPPPFGAAFQLQIPHDDWGPKKGDYYSDVRPDGQKQEWTLRATGLTAGKKYTLTWPSLSTLRREMRVTLADKSTGRKVNMRSATTFEFTADSANKDLTVSVDPRPQGGLQVLGMAITRTRGGVGASFSLSQDAGVSIEVITATGKRVKQLMATAPLTVGLHTVSWDGRDAQGTSLPPGQYIVSVSAVAEDGTVARAALPVVLTR